jgi:anti-anti-sigma regulatory factor
MSDAQPARQPRAVEIKADGDTIAAKIIGPVIEANRAQVILDDVGKAIDDAGSGLRFMVLDFDEVTFINSTGIGTCLELGARAKAQAARPILYRLTSDVNEPTDLAGAHPVRAATDRTAHLQGAQPTGRWSGQSANHPQLAKRMRKSTMSTTQSPLRSAEQLAQFEHGPH